MQARIRMVLLCAVLFCAHTSAQEQKPSGEPFQPKAPVNLGMEDGKVGQVPTGWSFPEECINNGYQLALSEDKPFAGKRCAVLSHETNSQQQQQFGTLLQYIDATNYRGKRVLFKAAVRTDVTGAGNQAQLWFRVDRTKEQEGFFDNMGDRPITAKNWKHYEIVGDVADDAQHIVIGMLLLGKGAAAIDDISFEIVNQSTKTTGIAKLPTPEPGLMEVLMAVKILPAGKATTATYLFPLPLAYRDQVPLTFRLVVQPHECAKEVEIIEGPGENRILKLALDNLDKHQDIKVAYNSVVLVAPTKFNAVPRSAKFPEEWPTEAKPWMASTWCCDHENERIKAMAGKIRGDSNDVIDVINKTLVSASQKMAKAKGRVNDLIATEALDKEGSCTSSANLVAALLRGAGIPSRILSGYPTWSGPLQTHYIVEAYVPQYGWYPVESTMCRAPWPNHQQVNVSVVPIEHESQAKAKMRNQVAGGVPYLSLTELENESDKVMAIGTLKEYCDHECRIVRPMTASDTEWASAMKWGKTRWETWLKSKSVLTDGKITFGFNASELKAKSISELLQELK